MPLKPKKETIQDSIRVTCIRPTKKFPKLCPQILLQITVFYISFFIWVHERPTQPHPSQATWMAYLPRETLKKMSRKPANYKIKPICQQTNNLKFKISGRKINEKLTWWQDKIMMMLARPIKVLDITDVKVSHRFCCDLNILNLNLWNLQTLRHMEHENAFKLKKIITFG